MKAIYALAVLILIPLISDAQGAFKRYGLSYDKNGKLLHGKFVQFSDDEQTKKVYHFNHGILTGEFLICTLNGDLLEKGNYMDGQKHGKWTNWSLAGIKTGEVKFNYGQRDGKWQIWDENGVLRYVMFYEVGEKVGKWQVYSESGELELEKEYTKTL